MLSRWTYIERSVAIAALVVAPWISIAVTDTSAGVAALPSLLKHFLLLLVVCIGLGIGLGLLLHRRLALQGVQWGGQEETAALLKQAAAELVSGQPDTNLFNNANKLAADQDGRATAIYLANRIAQLRQQTSFKRKTQPNPVSTPRRVAWFFVLAAISGFALSWPIYFAGKAPSYALPVAVALLTPFFITAVAVLGLGQAGADRWLLKLVRGGGNDPDSQIRLRKRGTKTAAGNWHTRSSRRDFPLLTVILVILLLCAIALYVLREYGDVLFQQPDLNSVTSIESPSDSRPVAAPTPQPPAQSAERLRPTTARAKRPAAADRRPVSGTKDTPITDIWAKLSPNGVLVHANPAAMQYAGRDIRQLERDFIRYKQARLDEWFILHLREFPNDMGRISFRLTLQAYGGVSDIELMASEISDPNFALGIIDRLEAIELSNSALDAVSVTLAFDFRL